jgi:hypothetical protein
MSPATKNNNNNNNSMLMAVGSSSSMKVVNHAGGRNDHHQGEMMGNGTSFFVVDTDTADDIDDVLMHQEEKMMMMGEEDDDEEVTSVESGGDMEDSMMTMAVLNSLVDHHGDGNPTFEDDDIGDDEDEVNEADHDDHPLRLSGDPRPDAAPSSFAATTTPMMGRSGRKRVRRDSVDYSKKTDKNQLVAAVVPNPLSRPIAPPAALPALKPGEALGPDNTTSDGTITTTTRGEKIASTGDDPIKKVNFSDQLVETSGGGRIRGFSIDLDCKCKHPSVNVTTLFFH